MSAAAKLTGRSGSTSESRGGGECVPVPARALASDAARRDFVALARERIAQAAAA